jgi:hypothetical protein
VIDPKELFSVKEPRPPNRWETFGLSSPEIGKSADIELDARKVTFAKKGRILET